MTITLPPKLKQYIEDRVKEGLYESPGDLVQDLLRQSLQRPAGDSIANALKASLDIETALLAVLFEAQQEASEDLKSILSEVRSINAAKRKMRELISKINHDVSVNLGRGGADTPLKFSPAGLGSEKAYHAAPLPYADTLSAGGVRVVSTDLWPEKIITVDMLNSIQDDLKGKLDSLSELSEMTSLRLQMIMDRRAKFIETLSNLMKKISRTQEGIVQNLK